MVDIKSTNVNKTHLDSPSNNKELITIKNNQEKSSIEDIEYIIYESIRNIRKDLAKRPDKEAIFSYIQKHHKLGNVDIGDIFENLENARKIYSKITKQGYPSYYKNENFQNTSSSNLHEITTTVNQNTNSNSNKLKSGEETVTDNNEFNIKDLLDTEIDKLKNQIEEIKEQFYKEVDNIQTLISENKTKELSITDQNQKETQTNLENEFQNTIQQSIENLKEEILFLRQERIHKNNIIEKLSILNVNQVDKVKDLNWKEIPQRHTRKNTDELNLNKNQILPSLEISNRYHPLSVDELPIQIDDDQQENENSKINKPTELNKQIQFRKRPFNIVNQHPENDKQTYSKRVSPGNSSYNDVVNSKRKVYIVGTSMIKGIRHKEFNNLLRNSRAIFKSFPGATLKELKHYIKFSLEEDSPDAIIFHGGCNDINPRNSQQNLSEENIAQGIIDISNVCREKGVSHVIISSLICRRNNFQKSNSDKC